MPHLRHFERRSHVRRWRPDWLVGAAGLNLCISKSDLLNFIPPQRGSRRRSGAPSSVARRGE